jgi:hypothetical protein
MRQQMHVTSAKTFARGWGRARVTRQHVVTGHAALLLGIWSTVVFVASAIISFVASYSQVAGREKLTLLLLGLLLPLLLAVIVRKRVETEIGVLGVLLGLSAPIIGIVGLIPPAEHIGSVAGSLALLIPLTGCGLVWATARKYRILQWTLIGCIVVASAITFISGESSAILGLVVGVVFSFGLVWRHRVAEDSGWLRVLDLAIATLFALGIGVYLLLILLPEQMGPLWEVLPDYYAQRFAAWRDTPAVIRDYLYTGSGLGVAPMVLSSYLFLVHVPFFHHVHNLFLQIGIEQGMPGLIGISGMFVAAFWSMTIAIRRAHAYVALCAASIMASLVSLFVSGLLESDVYAGPWVLIMFLPFGFAWVVAQYDVSRAASPRGMPNRAQPIDIAIGLIPVVLVAVLVVWPDSQTQWLANQAALAQNRSELTGYIAGQSPNQDDLRRDSRVNLDSSISLYRDALARDPNNVTALRRLAQIEIARGDYALALRNLERAYRIAPGERATRQMLGEMYAVEGRLDEATALWKTIAVAQQLLRNRHWWYNYIGDTKTAENIHTVLQRLGQ